MQAIVEENRLTNVHTRTQQTCTLYLPRVVADDCRTSINLPVCVGAVMWRGM